MKMPANFIHEEILEKGYITFARFMELALYCPDSGYYETDQKNVGRSGDFYTSVSVGPIFGQLLAFQFAAWLTPLAAASNPLYLIEAGAHDGQLAQDILGALRDHHPAVFEKMNYIILEPSARRQSWQQETLQRFTGKVQWKSSFSALNQSHAASLNGIIFSNELLDAFPIHRFVWDATKLIWSELGVIFENKQFQWAKIPGLTPKTPPKALAAVLPDGYIIETSPAAVAWWQEAARSLQAGKLMAFDYGLIDDELYQPSRVNGTLRAYSKHHISGNVLETPGEQDLTAHVNFSAIQEAGEASGLSTDAFLTQAQFLTRVLAEMNKTSILKNWGPAQMRQFQTLTHPEHLGRPFKVLIQSR